MKKIILMTMLMSAVFAQALKPSFAIGGYLILLAIIIQLYACLSSPDTVSESTNDNAANDKKTSD